MAWSTRSEGRRILRTLLASYQQEGVSTPRSLTPPQAKLSRLLAQAQIAPQWMQRSGIAVVVMTLLASVIGGYRSGSAMLLLGGFVVFSHIGFRARRNRTVIDRDLPALLTSVASSVRAGMDPLSALVEAREYFPKGALLVQEIEKLRKGLAEGRDEEDLVGEFLALYGNQDAELFRRCLILSRRHGGSLGEPLHRITRVVRQRQSFRRKTRAALAMHRMSAIGIALCAAAMTALQCAMNPQSLELSIHHPIGSKLLVGGILLIVTGLGWMLRMGREAKLQ